MCSLLLPCPFSSEGREDELCRRGGSADLFPDKLPEVMVLLRRSPLQV
jgi:hypothetical protein